MFMTQTVLVRDLSKALLKSISTCCLLYLGHWHGSVLPEIIQGHLIDFAELKIIPHFRSFNTSRLHASIELKQSITLTEKSSWLI